MRSMISGAAFAALAMTAPGPSLAQAPVQAVRTAYALEPFTPPSQITIQGTGVRLRAEPFTNPPAQVLSSGSTGLPLNVVGIARLPDWNWYQVILKSGQKAFIRSDYTSAPSKGAGAAAPLPATTRIDYPPTAPTMPAAPTPPAFSPVFSAPAAPPAQTASDSAPLSAPVIAPAAPVAPAPAFQARPPVSAPAYTPASPTAPLAPDAPIALTPRSSAPSGASDASGLQSKPPGQ